MRHRRDDGATLIEFALVLPLFIILVFGLIELGRFLAISNGLNSVTREAARYGSSVGDSINSIPRYTDCDEIRAAGMAMSNALTAMDITINYDSGPSTPMVTTCPTMTTIAPAAITNGDRIEVTAAVQFDFVVPIVGDIMSALSGGYMITSTDRRTIFK